MPLEILVGDFVAVANLLPWDRPILNPGVLDEARDAPLLARFYAGFRKTPFWRSWHTRPHPGMYQLCYVARRILQEATAPHVLRGRARRADRDRPVETQNVESRFPKVWTYTKAAVREGAVWTHRKPAPLAFEASTSWGLVVSIMPLRILTDLNEPVPVRLSGEAWDIDETALELCSRLRIWLLRWGYSSGLRRCPICDGVFVAKRKDQPCCSVTHAKVRRTRRWRAGEYEVRRQLKKP